MFGWENVLFLIGAATVGYLIARALMWLSRDPDSH